MKNFIVQHAWARAHPQPASVLGPIAKDGWPPKLNVVYNLAAGDPAHENNPCAPGHLGKRDNSSASACSASYSSLNATSFTSSRYVATFNTDFKANHPRPASTRKASNSTIQTSSVTSHTETTKPAESTSTKSGGTTSTSESSFVYYTTTGATIYVVQTQTVTVTETTSLMNLATIDPSTFSGELKASPSPTMIGPELLPEPPKGPGGKVG